MPTIQPTQCTAKPQSSARFKTRGGARWSRAAGRVFNGLSSSCNQCPREGNNFHQNGAWRTGRIPSERLRTHASTEVRYGGGRVEEDDTFLKGRGAQKTKTHGGRGMRRRRRHAAAFLNSPICARIASLAAADMVRAPAKLRHTCNFICLFPEGPWGTHSLPARKLDREALLNSSATRARPRRGSRMNRGAAVLALVLVASLSCPGLLPV